MLVLGVAKSTDKNKREILPKNVFGDLRIITEPMDLGELKESMVIYKGDIPLIYLFRNDANEVSGFGITCGNDGMPGWAQLAKSGISDFVVYGNKIHAESRTAVLVLTASDKPGVRRHLGYGLSVPKYDDNKVPGHRIPSYRIVGDVYRDLDFDGRFDAKEVFNDKSVVVSESIFVNGEWRELGRLDSNSQFIERLKRVGSFDDKNLTAFTAGGG